MPVLWLILLYMFNSGPGPPVNVRRSVWYFFTYGLPRRASIESKRWKATKTAHEGGKLASNDYNILDEYLSIKETDQWPSIADLRSMCLMPCAEHGHGDWPTDSSHVC